MTVLTWTDDRVEQLKKLWESGLSASQIAAELGNRQSPSAWAFRPRQEPLLGGAASAQGPPGPAHDAGFAPGLAWQHGAGPRFRSRDGTGSDRLRQCGADEPAAVAAGAE